MKVIIQSEATECGLASLAMVANHHGHGITLREMRQRFPLSLKGAKLRYLIQIAQQLGFSARPLRVELEHLGAIALPCILHWNLNHFVVLAKVGRSKVTIIDPASGERSLPLTEVSKFFTGVVLELTPTADFTVRKAAPAVTLRQLTGPVRGIWRSLGLVLLLSLSLQVFVVLAPFFIQWVVDHVLVSADRDLLAVLGIGFGLALLLQVGIGLLRGWSVVYLSARLGLQWMGNVFAHLLRLPLGYFEKRHIGDITSRMSSVRSIQQTLTTSFVEALIDGLMAVVTLSVMFVYSWKLTLVTLLAVGMYLIVRMASYRPLRDTTEKQLMSAAKQETHLLESIRGMQSLKIAGHEPARRAAYENLMVDTVNKEVGLARMGIGFEGANQLIFGIERIAVIWIGASLALQNVFSVGMLIAYLAFKDQFAQRVAALIDKAVDFRMLRLHGERLSDIVLSEPEDTGQLTDYSPKRPPRIEVRNVYFRYSGDEPWVIEDCSFALDPGESVSITGPSGCGKTTLIKLMLGLLKPTQGQILADGMDIHGVGIASVRSVFGAVMQDDELFAGSIADNISLFDSEFDEDRIQAAARLASIHDEIMMMPMGYHSLIGDMGSALSGGQKQRVILARALYRNPLVLFLDEATSHLDVHREHLVSDAIRQLDMTRIIVAHRPETINSADRVLVMEGGKVVREVQRTVPSAGPQ